MAYVVVILSAIVFVVFAVWAQKKLSKYETTMKDADGNVESHEEGKMK